jgi:transposase
VIDDRSASALVSWMSERDAHWRAAITTAALDPYRRYATALRTALPHALRVLDGFHVLRLGFAAVDDARRRIQRAPRPQRRQALPDPQVAAPRPRSPSERSWARLLAGLDTGDTTDEQLARIWIAAQDPCLIFSCPDRARAEQALYRWLAYCADAGIPELTRLARTIDSWRAELLAYSTPAASYRAVSVRVA